METLFDLLLEYKVEKLQTIEMGGTKNCHNIKTNLTASIVRDVSPRIVATFYLFLFMQTCCWPYVGNLTEYLEFSIRMLRPWGV